MESSFIPFDDDFSNVPKWEANFHYYEGDVVVYGGEVYEVLENIISEESSTPNKSDDYLHMKISKIKEVY